MTLQTPAAPGDRPLGRLERRKARTRAAILDAANRLFQQQGYEETSIQQIAELADTGVGTVYGYFAAKEQILREVLRTHTQEAVARYHAAVSEDTPAIDRVLAALDTFAQYLRENRTVLLAAFQTAAGTRPLEEEEADWLFEAYSNLIREGVQGGELRDVPVSATVRMLIGSYSMAVLGVGPWAGQEEDPGTLPELERLVRTLLER
ncbi:MAG: TetR/AcrR family transcriptional regulator [Dehalococcoidia bacterium]|nr:TetR/AcrR family transcriptional regulator [Dehalococcoidia bacterium]